MDWLMTPEVEALTQAYTQTLQAGIWGIALLMVIVMLVGLGVAFVMARGFNRMLLNAGTNEESSNAAITQLAVALTSNAQQQQNQTQLAQRQIDLLTELPSKLAHLLSRPINDLRTQMENLIARFEDMENRSDQRLDRIETTLKTTIEDAKLKPGDFKPIIDMLDEWRTLEKQDHEKINRQLTKLIELHQPPPTEPDDQPAPASSKTGAKVVNVDAAQHDIELPRTGTEG